MGSRKARPRPPRGVQRSDVPDADQSPTGGRQARRTQPQEPFPVKSPRRSLTGRRAASYNPPSALQTDAHHASYPARRPTLVCLPRAQFPIPALLAAGLHLTALLIAAVCLLWFGIVLHHAIGRHPGPVSRARTIAPPSSRPKGL